MLSVAFFSPLSEKDEEHAENANNADIIAVSRPCLAKGLLQ